MPIALKTSIFYCAKCQFYLVTINKNSQIICKYIEKYFIMYYNDSAKPTEYFENRDNFPLGESYTFLSISPKIPTEFVKNADSLLGYWCE